MIIEEKNLSRKAYLEWVSKESGVKLTRLRSQRWKIWERESITSSKFN